jgi:hypothetical protein
VTLRPAAGHRRTRWGPRCRSGRQRRRRPLASMARVRGAETSWGTGGMDGVDFVGGRSCRG